MGKKARREPLPDFTGVHVRLKPIMGLRPGLYLTVLYGLAVVVILFFLLFYPGLRKRGTYYAFETFPAGASVRADGEYLGSTPGEFLVPAGQRRIEITKPFYKDVVLTEEVGGRVFATLFIPPRRQAGYSLEVEDLDGLLEYSLDDFASTPYIPEIMIQTVEGLNSDPSAYPEMYDYLHNAKYFVQSVRQTAGLTRALALLDSGGQAPSPASYLASVQNFIRLIEEYDNAVYWFLVSLSQELGRRLTGTEWFSAYHGRFLQDLERGFDAGSAARSPAEPTVNVAGISLRGIPGGTLVMGRDDDVNFWRDRIDLLLPHPVAVPPFRMAETEISNRQFQRFLDENPDWKKSNLDELISRGLADEEYLAHWDGDAFPSGQADLPVVNVSWPAADAFCAWLTDQLGDRFPGYRVRLPYEAEWEWAARGGLSAQPYPAGRSPGDARLWAENVQGPAAVGASAPNGYGLRDMIGNVWEWCADWYSPVSYFFSSREADKNEFSTERRILRGSEKSVRGGSWANEKELIRVYTRGSQPPAWGTPYLGFRPVLSRY